MPLNFPKNKITQVMWNSTFFNVQILDVFSLEREKNLQKRFTEKPVTVKFI